MRKVILIQPTFCEHRYTPDEIITPMALLSISAPLVELGYEVRIINQQADPDWRRTLKEELKDHPVCVGVTSLTGLQIYFALQASKIVKENSDVPVVWGGVHSSMTPVEAASHHWIDYVVKGEAEETFPALIRAIENSDTKELKIPGVYRRENGTVVGEPCGPPPDLERLGLLPFHLDPLFMADKHPKLTLITSRGCPHRCGFCFNNFYYGRRWRALSAGRVLELIDQYMEAYGPAGRYGKDLVINFGTESNFFVDARRVDDICQGILDRGLSVNWDGVSCRVDYHRQIKPSTLKKLYRLGCRRLLFGVEAGSEEMLRHIKKDIVIQDVFAMARKVTDCGIAFHGSFIFGFPGETHRNRMDIVDLVSKLKALHGKMFTYGFFIYAPFPGTELYDEGLELGFRPPRRLVEWIRVEQRFPQNVPWLSAEDDRRIQHLRALGLVGGVYEEDGLAGKVYGLLGRWGSYRLKHHLFGPVPELKLQELLNDVYSLAVLGRRRRYQTFHHDPLFDRLETLVAEVG